MTINTQYSEVLSLVNPADETVFLKLHLMEFKDIRDKIELSRISFSSWKSTSLNKRKQIIRQIIDYFQNNKNQIATDITKQMGKPIQQSLNEVDGAIYRMNGLIEISESALKVTNFSDVNGITKKVIREPLGVVLDISAWNYPLLIAVNIVIASVLAGNSVILKHSSTTPLCGKVFEDAFNFSDAPEKLVQNIICNHNTLSEIIRANVFDHISFTGSVNGGRSISISNKSNFIGLGLELGGKDPAYICDDADLDFTIPNVMDGVFYNAGQSCCGVERIYVHENVYDKFLNGAINEFEKLKIGDPFKKDITLGPLAHKKSIQFLENQKQDAIKKGAEIIEFNGSIPKLGNFLRPFIAVNCNHDMDLMKEESFGPIVGIMKVKSDEEAIELMNDSEFGLTASIWTTNDSRANYLAKNIESGTIFQNRCDVLDPELPWVGIKNSGHGVSLGEIGIQQLTRPKSFNFKKI
jgi:acyl-CoA reductase-like NAD-dependent aldehyde dehydrogenase